MYLKMYDVLLIKLVFSFISTIIIYFKNDVKFIIINSFSGLLTSAV